MIFVILAGVFLGTLILNENRSNMSTSDTLVDSQLGINAVSIANSYIERISTPSLAFDEYLLSNAVQPSSTDSLAKLSLLTVVPGRESGETSQSLYDDVDDFNGLDTMVTVSRVGSFHVLCRVEYYDPATGSVPGVGNNTWYKRATVMVTDTVPGSTYHNFKFKDDQKSEIRRQLVVSYFKFLQ
jgi:hypothetical protein